MVFEVATQGWAGGAPPNPSQNQSIAVVVGRTGNGSGDGTGTEGSTVRAGTQRYGRATERAQRSRPDKTAKTPSASLVGDRPDGVAAETSRRRAASGRRRRRGGSP